MKPGFAFGEHIKTEKIKRRNYPTGKMGFSTRDFFLPLVLLIVAALLIFKLFYLQIIKGDDYRVLSDSNRIRTQVIRAPRGVIFDRNGIPLVQNSPGFRQTINKKSTILSRDQALPLLANGINLEVDSKRSYLYKDSMSHVLGYIGQISKEEIKQLEFDDYQATDWIGKTGIERQYEHILRGVDGKQLYEVDAREQKVRSLGQTDPIPGQDIALTIDSKLQKAVYVAAQDIKKGAVIVSSPRGEILAMVSKPSFDPNLFTLDKTYKTATDAAHKNVSDILLDTQNQPLLNRATSGTYPPGSTFKIVTAAAGLQDKIIDENYRVQDIGVIKIGEFSFANWYYTGYGRTEPGDLNVVRGLARSNDIFFYKLAEKIGLDKLSEMAEKFGLGSKLDIDLPGEEAAVVPTEKWKKDHIGESWYLGDTYHYGIGQGYLLTTPLQVNSWTQVVANGGNLYEPHLLKTENDKLKKQNILNEKTISLIKQGMIESCSTGGVAWPLFDFKVKNVKLKVDGKNFLQVASASADMRKVVIACKTGTAQHGGEDTKPHAWITLFAPAYNPEIVVTVLKEESGEGSNEAAPIAKKILESYFSK